MYKIVGKSMRSRILIRNLGLMVTLVVISLMVKYSYAVTSFEPYMVKDLVTKGEGTGIFDKTIVGQTMYFTASTKDYGRELWKTDGTEEGTLMVKDIRPGPDSSWPENLCDVDGTLFFSAKDGENGYELWKSDGTEVGTIMVRNFTPGEKSSRIYEIVSYKGLAIFSRARSIDEGEGWFLVVQHELYKSDGTAAGTVLVKDINPFYNETVYPPRPIGSEPRHFIVAGDYAYFEADDGIHGRQMWRTDGTEEGTILIEQPGICPDFDFYIYNLPHAFKNGNLFFAANDTEHGFGLWKTDGTPQGTEFVKTIDEEPADSYEYVQFHDFGSNFIISKWGELWKSDGTETGTFIIKEGFSGKVYGNTINNLFVFNIGQEYQTLPEIYVSDGTATGTYMLMRTEGGYYPPSDFFVLEDVLIFRLSDDLWITDGTEQGTKLLFEPIFSPPNPYHLKTINNKAFFSMDDGVHGVELWATTKLPNSHYMVKDINTGTEGAYIGDMHAIGDTLYFIAETNITPEYNSKQLWKTDGTDEGTGLVWPGHIIEFNVVGDMLFFTTYEDNNVQLYLKKGTEQAITQIWEDWWISLPSFISEKGQIFFQTNDDNAVDPESGSITIRHSIYTTYGAYEDTKLLYEVYGRSSVGSQFTEYKGEIIFAGVDQEHGDEIWKTDGTPEGTRLFLDLDPGCLRSSSPRKFTQYNGLLFFSADIEGYGFELWKTDGSVEGTNLVKDFWPGLCLQWWGGYSDCSSVMLPLAVINEKLLLQGFNKLNYDYYGLPSLWVSDGSADGSLPLETSLVDTLVLRSDFYDVVEFKGELYFSGQDIGLSDAASRHNRYSPCNDHYGAELWKTDGTVEGTVMIADLTPCPPDNPLGIRSSYPDSFVVADDLLFFLAMDNENYHLFMTDGNVGKVSKIDSDRPPRAYANGTVFFENDDEIHGNELWAVRTKVFIDKCNTGVTDKKYEENFITTWINECADSAKNHGKFVSCVSHLTNNLKKAGIINGSEKGAIQNCAALADTP